MKVGIVGAGAIAFAMAAFLEQAGHAASLWSPSGARTKALAAGEKLVAAGAIEGTFNASGHVPRCAEEISARGFALDNALFTRPPSR